MQNPNFVFAGQVRDGAGGTPLGKSPAEQMCQIRVPVLHSSPERLRVKGFKTLNTHLIKCSH